MFSWTVIRTYLVRFLVGIIFPIIAPFVSQFGITENDLANLILTLLLGGVGVGSIINVITNAAKTDPVTFARKAQAARGR